MQIAGLSSKSRVQLHDCHSSAWRLQGGAKRMGMALGLESEPYVKIC